MPALPGLLLIAFIVVLVIAQYLKILRMAQRLPPGPTPFPVIGTLWQMRFEFSYETLITLAKSHGNVFTLWLGQLPIIILNGFEAVKEGLTAHPEDMNGRPTSPFFEKLGKGKGIIFASGNVWKQHRRIGAMGLKFLSQGKSGLERQIQEEALDLIEVFDSTQGQPMEPSFPIVLAVSNVICALLFGYRFSKEDETFHRLIKSTEVILQIGGSAWQIVYEIFPWIMNHLPGRHQKAFACYDFSISFVMKEIRSREKSGTLDNPQNFIDFYLAQMAKSKDDPTSTLDENNLAYSIFDFFIAGSETTATTLHWALLYMVAYPDTQAKVQKELDDTLGSSSRLICCSDRRNLPYTNAVIHEIQRYANIILIGGPRQSVKDTTVLGFPIQKGMTVIPNISSVLLDPKQWETPECFNPGHFLDEKGNFINREAFIPFSIGQRACLGENLARMELFLLFTNLLRRFHFQLPEGVTEVNTKYIKGMTLQPRPQLLHALPR
ncbi:cytochrome P450 2J6-like [Crotalus tigris]|uniref:cytochrome P450 2J6-like n=1 Tax=Crotalus tigris TaxID=88082 RepID=UPI00192FA6C7|nr:cytochrome P450 2J6-like [Crotalus tigris]